jgi:hypothetical protein
MVGLPHVVPVESIGVRDGRVVARMQQVDAAALSDVLAALGSLTEGVASTLSTPLIALLQSIVERGVDLGRIAVDGVVVDDSGSPLVLDEPPGPRSDCSPSAPISGIAVDARRRRAAGQGDDIGWSAIDDRRSGLRQVLFGIRAIWERVDARSVARAEVERAIDRALGEPSGAALGSLAAAVRAAGPPRPVRWATPRRTPRSPDQPRQATSRRGTDVVSPRSRWMRSVLALAQDGVPLAHGTRLTLRKVLVGVVVIVGVAVATTFAVDGASGGDAQARPRPATAVSRAPEPGTEPEARSGTVRAETPGSSTTTDPVRAALELFEVRHACRARREPTGCLRRTTVANSVARELDDLNSDGVVEVLPAPATAGPAASTSASPSASSQVTEDDPAWKSGAVVDRAVTRRGEIALVRLVDGTGTTTASVLLERSEAGAGWLLRSRIDSSDG